MWHALCEHESGSKFKMVCEFGANVKTKYKSGKLVTFKPFPK